MYLIFFLIIKEKNFMLIEIYIGGSELFLKDLLKPHLLDVLRFNQATCITFQNIF